MPEVSSTSLSDAWLATVRLAGSSRGHELLPLSVELHLDNNETLGEDPEVRRALNEALRTRGKGSIETVANTIFPYSLWNPRRSRRFLFRRYLNLLPVLRRYPLNRRGLYFERMINYPGKLGEAGLNQLDHVITTFEKGNHRRSALQAAILVPEEDLNDARQQVFPCLHQVAFIPNGVRGTLGVTGFYAMQYLFARAYGNYLGLARLGRFMAREMGLTLTRVVCVASVAKLDVPRSQIHSLLRRFPGSFGAQAPEC